MIGQRIAEARKRKNLSQTQLAGQLFISSQAVGKWERGESMPDIITFTRLAEILGVDLNYFIGGSSDLAAEGSETEAKQKEQEDPGEQGIKAKPNWNMSFGNWVDADFSDLKGLHERLSASNLKRCLFKNADLAGITLRSNTIDSCDFSDADLSGSHIHSSSLINTNFAGCSLKGVVLSTSSIKGCDLTGADLSGAVVRLSTIQKCTMNTAVWKGTSFYMSRFADTVLDGMWADCSFENCDFSRVSFEHACFTNTFFKGSKLKRIHFVDCSADRLTYAFLKNGGAELSGISIKE
jgi:uncharacterized protein YjbI with pentapeptide repeats/DNA-binding XRE family transcriptional regulator